MIIELIFYINYLLYFDCILLFSFCFIFVKFCFFELILFHDNNLQFEFFFEEQERRKWMILEQINNK